MVYLENGLQPGIRILENGKIVALSYTLYHSVDLNAANLLIDSSSINFRITQLKLTDWYKTCITGAYIYTTLLLLVHSWSARDAVHVLTQCSLLTQAFTEC